MFAGGAGNSVLTSIPELPCPSSRGRRPGSPFRAYTAMYLVWVMTVKALSVLVQAQVFRNAQPGALLGS